MPKFSVSLMTSVEFVTDVEAENEDDAIDMALEIAPVQVCAQCSGVGKPNYQELIINSDFWEPIDAFERDAD